MTENYDLKEEIRDYWSVRSKTFDLAFGHRIPAGPEFDAWAKAMREHIGGRPLRILELACGTGEITSVLLSLGHDVTAIDFSEAMLAVAAAKHAGQERARFLLADAENTMLPDATYDAVVCRHLVWTLTSPHQAFCDWQRVLKPGGKLLVFDGDWSCPTPLGRLAELAVRVIDRFKGEDPHYSGAMIERHNRIMARLPFGDGLTPEKLIPFIANAGFEAARTAPHAPIAAAQRSTADLRNCLRTLFYCRFILSAEKPL